MSIKIRKSSTVLNLRYLIAETEGFEPSVEFPLHTLSKRAPSATRTSLRFLRVAKIQFQSL